MGLRIIQNTSSRQIQSIVLSTLLRRIRCHNFGYNFRMARDLIISWFLTLELILLPYGLKVWRGWSQLIRFFVRLSTAADFRQFCTFCRLKFRKLARSLFSCNFIFSATPSAHLSGGWWHFQGSVTVNLGHVRALGSAARYNAQQLR